MEKRYIIIPGCCDLNRGDQALGWETKRIAEDSGFKGKYSILAEEGEPITQSQEEGYEILTPILQHPSRNFKNKENINYTFGIKIKWGLVAVGDLINSLIYLIPGIRNIAIKLCKDEKKIQALKRFIEADAIFMKGGGLIQSHGGILSTYATYYRIYHIILAQSFNKPVYIMPNSFGPFKGPGVKLMTKFALKRCKLVTVREKVSKEVIKKELGLDVNCYPDLAFFLPNASVNKEEILNKYNLPNDKKLIAITMRPYRFPNSDDPKIAYENFKLEMKKFVEWIYDQGHMAVIIEHTLAITSHENDGDCIKDVIRNIDSKKYRIISNKNINCYGLKSIYGCCDYIVGTRFHSMIFSLSNMVPGIAISYDGYKSIGIMGDMDLQDYVIDIADVSCEKLKNMIISVMQEEELVKKKIDKYIKDAYILRENLIKEISDK